jgi:2-haloacid dehalogenase
MLNGRPVQAIVFDAYGTLLDVASVARACAAVTAEPSPFVALWRQKQLEYSWQRALMNQYADFWQVTGEALDYAAVRLGVRLDAASRERLRQAWLELQPFPEVAAALQRLSGRPLAVLSNGSPAMLTAVFERSGLRPPLTHLLSVDEVHTYKPRPAVYEIAPRTLGLTRPEIVFVSGNPWDAAGAANFGFRVAWLNRAGLPFDNLGQTPELVLTSLAELPDALGV